MFGKLKDAFKKTVENVKKTVTEKAITQDEFDEIFWNLEMDLTQLNVAPQVIDVFRTELEKQLVGVSVKKSNVEGQVRDAIKNILTKAITTKDLIKEIKEKTKPVKILLLGFNGAGKTTTIAKLTKKLKDNGLSTVWVAGDTYRAASIEQLEQHAENLKIRVIKHDYGSDTTAVAFDAIKHAEAKKIDCVLIDTAGRSHDNANLMKELEKITRVIKPDIKILIIDSLTGSDSINQAKKFDEASGIDGLILTKTDSDTKGGTILSVSYVLQKPIYYLGTGQEYDNLEKADVNELIKKVL